MTDTPAEPSPSREALEEAAAVITAHSVMTDRPDEIACRYTALKHDMALALDRFAAAPMELPPLDGEWDYKGDDPAWQILYRWCKRYEQQDDSTARLVGALFLHGGGGGLHVLARAINAAIDDARRAALEEAAQLCDAEADARNRRADSPLPGDENLGPFTIKDMQLTKAITARFLGKYIRALLPNPNTQGEDDGTA